MKKIILNWMPPSMVEMPSPAMSILKQFLTSNSFSVNILYWNLLLNNIQKEFLWWPKSTLTDSEMHAELLFYNYLAIKEKDSTAYSKVKSVLISIKPQYLSVGESFFDHHMKIYAEKLDTLLDEELDKWDFENIYYIGMSVNLYQWICSSIIAKKIKQRSAFVPIVIGGMGTKEAAISFLKNFTQFDIALWGEGEYGLLELSKYIADNICDIERKLQIPNMAFRENNEVLVSQIVNHEYIDLSSEKIQPNFEDYFDQLNLLGKEKSDIKIIICIEGSRSCHWKKCKFCYLNTGYKYRLKPVCSIETEIRSMIEKYQIYDFSFLDNDIIGNDKNRFSSLLDSLISIKEDYPKFRIVLAEIITKNIQAALIRKMALAGFIHVQIGYESASDTLLKKINKKNTFASNLLFIKFAFEYDIMVGGANIIRGLLEETYEDILEAIINLHSLRFFYQGGKFKHTMTNLGIMHSSRYYRQISDNQSNFRFGHLVSFLPANFITEEELNKCTIIEKMHIKDKETWDNFSIVEAHYLKSKYEYHIFSKPTSILYVEKLNEEIINEIEIDCSSLDFFILYNANERVLSLDELYDLLSNSQYKNTIDCELFNILEELKKEGLIYTTPDYSEIISIININNTK